MKGQKESLVLSHNSSKNPVASTHGEIPYLLWPLKQSMFHLFNKCLLQFSLPANLHGPRWWWEIKSMFVYFSEICPHTTTPSNGTSRKWGQNDKSAQLQGLPHTRWSVDIFPLGIGRRSLLDHYAPTSSFLSTLLSSHIGYLPPWNLLWAAGWSVGDESRKDHENHKWLSFTSLSCSISSTAHFYSLSPINSRDICQVLWPVQYYTHGWKRYTYHCPVKFKVRFYLMLWKN